MRTPLLLLLCVPLGAQSVVYSPPVDTSKPGSGYAVRFGSSWDSRTQFIDGESVAALEDKAITAVSFRIDEKAPTYSFKRSWTLVTLTVALGGWGTWQGQPIVIPSGTFTANLQYAPTIVYSGFTTLPDSNTPQSWSNFHFPFKAPKVVNPKSYQGVKGGVVLDFVFVGGHYKNGVWVNDPGAYTYIDSAAYSTSFGFRGNYPPIGPGEKCADSSREPGSTAVAVISGSGTPRGYLSPKDAGGISIFVGATNTPVIKLWPNQPQVLVLGLPDNTGFQARCNPLLVRPLLLINVTGKGSWQYSGKFRGTLGFQLGAQVAWEDTKSKLLSLTKAAFADVPQPPPCYRRAALFGWSTSKTATVSAWPAHQPLIRYSAK